MRLRQAIPFFFLPALACVPQDDAGNDGDVQQVDSALSCDCGELDLLASEVSYDNTVSGLQSTSVQEALDEIAGSERPVRISQIAQLESTDDAIPQESQLVVVAGCGGGIADHLVLGGGCSTDSPNLTLVQAQIEEGVFRCEWNKPAGQEASGTAKATCLSVTP